ncbi:MAG: patatin-like phospholipase family protein [Tetrasphaera sp.]|jgi:NTE family protein|nr:patatin-like phospholipase family protein [Tetrasphaera sp.]
MTPRTAFVLGGGGVLGATQVGMLRALAEAGIVPDLVLGTSIGALNGAFVAADPSLEGILRLGEVWHEVVREGLFTQRPIRQVARIPRNWTHLLSHAPLRLLLERYLPVSTFADLQVPFQCVAAQIEGCRATWFDAGPLAPPVLASCSVPGLFPPVRIDGAHYLDGGLVHSIPVGRALDLGAEEIYVLQVGRIEQPLEPPSAPWQVATVAFEISRRHRYVEEISRVPDTVALRVLPSGTASAPTVSLVQARQGRMADRMDAAYAASTAYLQEHRPS